MAEINYPFGGQVVEVTPDASVSDVNAALAQSAHNRAISRIVNALMDLLTQSREESLHTPGRPTRSHQDHVRILEAIRRRRGE